MSAWTWSMSNFLLRAWMNSLSASSTRRTTPSGSVTEPESTFFFDASEGFPNGSATFLSCSTRGLSMSASCSSVVPSKWPER